MVDDANVAILLSDAGFFHVPHPAEDLQRGRTADRSAVSVHQPLTTGIINSTKAPCASLRTFSSGWLLRRNPVTLPLRTPQRPHRFDIGFLPHQHAPNVGMFDDRFGRFGTRTRLEIAALDALLSVLERML